MRLRFLFLPAFALTLAPACRTTETKLATAPSEAAPTVVASNPEPAAVAAQDERAGIELRRDRAQFLAAEYLKVGDKKRDEGDIRAALSQYANALEVDPTSVTARERLARMKALLGDKYMDMGEQFQDAKEREIVRRAQAQMAAEEAVRRAEAAMAQGRYETAVAAFREAESILVWHPLVAKDSLDARIIGARMNDALDQLEVSRMAEQALKLAAAEAEAAHKEEEVRNYRANKLRTLFQDANSAFLADQYSRAEALCEQILLEDPQNSAATKLRDAAALARHNKTELDTLARYREQWIRTFEEVDIMDVPQTTPLVFDDLRRWAEVNRRQALEFTAKATAADADTAAVIERLAAVRFAPRFRTADGEGVPLAEVASFLQNLTGVNFLVSAKVMEELDEEAQQVDMDLPERSVRNVLEIIVETHENLRWKVQDGVVKFVTKAETFGNQILKMYEVRDIIHPIPSFPGREINIAPSGGLEQPDEEVEEREGLVVTSDNLETLVRDNVATESWNEDPLNSVRITEAGTMVVNQTPEVQEQVKKLLDDLREATGIMVDIQARFLRVEDNFLEDIGIDFRGLGQPGLGTNTFINDFGDASTQADLGKEIGQGSDLGAFYDDGQDGDLRTRVENLYDVSLGNADVLQATGGLSFSWTYLSDLQMQMVLRAVSKSERREIVTSPKLLVFNTARANLSVMNQVAYVQDFDVEIAQAASIADPIVETVQDGVVLDVRPVVSADRRFIMMELRPTVATLRRPIREVATTLGSQNAVTIQLPEIDIQRVRTTVPMPDGGTVMLGGLKVSEKQDLRSGIPIINKIPLVRFLFDRQGTYATNQKLLILVTANIVIPEELEPLPSQLGN
ncbi:MAG: type II and III secretion system protein [Planctomycetes bacterium]|nr:type II and III secretion system protein [Planctomycetota bacterium]